MLPVRSVAGLSILDVVDQFLAGPIPTVRSERPYNLVQSECTVLGWMKVT